MLFVSILFIGLTITFALIARRNALHFNDALNGYNTLVTQCQEYETSVADLNKQINDLNYDLKVKDVYIEIANKEADEQKAYVKEYQDYLNDLKVQLALRGIETGDFSALDSIGEDFAKQYEELKEKEAEIEAERQASENGEVTDGNTSSSSSEEESGWNAWGNMMSGDGN